jgi:hypothetical protein
VRALGAQLLRDAGRGSYRCVALGPSIDRAGTKKRDAGATGASFDNDKKR